MRIERRGAPRGEAAGCDVGGREPGEAGAVGRQRQARVRDAREPHERALDAARLGERHELAREPGHEGMDAGALAGRAQTAGACHRAGQQVVARRQREERLDVVVEPEQEAQAVERGRIVRCGERDLERAVGALRDARVRRPRGRREDELRAVVEQPQRAVAHAAERLAQVVRAARAHVDQRRHGTSSAAGGGASANPGATSSSVAMRARRARRRASWSRGRPSDAATSSRGAAT